MDGMSGRQAAAFASARAGAAHGPRRGAPGPRARATRARRLLLALVAPAALVAGVWAGLPGAAQASEECAPSNTFTAAVAWGANGKEQLGAGFRSGKENAPRTVLGLSGIRELQAGFKVQFAILANCTVVTWGDNERGKLGDGIPHVAQAHPVPVVHLENVKEVNPAKGPNGHPIALEYNGSVWTWGAAEFGERGNGERGFESYAKTNPKEKEFAKPRYEPAQVPNLPRVKQVAAGGVRDYALVESTGEVLAWGGNERGELGVEWPSGEPEEKCNGEPAPKLALPCVTRPHNVKVNGNTENLSGVEKIAAGNGTGYAVRGGGTEILAWGSDTKGQVGNLNATDPTTHAVKLEWTPPSPVVEIAPGSSYALVRLENGQVYGWGANQNGQLGFESGPGSEECGKSKCSKTPVRVPALTHVVQLSAGDGNTFALKEEENGKHVIYAFGRNSYFELLGLGRALEGADRATSTPTPIEGLASVASVSAGAATSDAALESGSGPAPALGVTPFAGGLQVAWAALAEAYKYHWRPVGTRPWSTSAQEKLCTPGTQCPFTVKVEPLPAEPYEFSLIPGKITGGKFGEQERPVRFIIGTPEPPPGAPVNVKPPTIGGTAREGQVVTETQGTWTNVPTSRSYEWLRCEGFGMNGTEEGFGEECDAIVDETGQKETGQTYTPQQIDVGHTIRVKEKVSNAQGSGVAFTELVVVRGLAEDEQEEVPPAPENVTPPKITGNASPGQELKLQEGDPRQRWEHEPLTVADQWWRCRALTAEQEIATACNPITDAPKAEKEPPPRHEGSTYMLRSEDAGKFIEVKEVATNSGGWNAAISNAIEVLPSEVPVNEKLPTIEGIAQQDQKLTEANGTWTNNPDPKGYKYQWLRCDSAGNACSEITEKKGTVLATKSEYKLVSEDVGHTIRVRETASNAVGTSAPAVSQPTSEVPKPPRAPTNSTKPTITGTAHQGETLTSHPGSWNFESFAETGYEYPKTYDYLWKRCKTEIINEKPKEVCKEIRGTSESLSAPGETTYVLTGEDVGSWIRVKETVRIPGSVEVAESERTEAVVGAPPHSTAPPMIEGTVRQGQTLSEVHGKWTGEPLPNGYTYQWKRCTQSGCEAIAEANGQQYLLSAADVDHTIVVEETASNGSGTSAPASSSPTAEVLPEEPTTTSPPTISGSAQQGQTLTEAHAPWTNNPTSYAYQWKRCDSAGASCSDIEGATSQTHVLTASDVGHTIKVKETAKNAGGWGAATSEPTAVVVVPAPSVMRVEPAKGPTGGGTTVTISGENLGEASAVEFGFVMATKVEVISSTTIKAVSPPGTGTVDVRVTTPNGRSEVSERDRFTYVPPPSVSKVEPSQGPEAGGASVIVTGANLEEASAVKFGASSATSVEALSPTSIRATSPAGTGTVDVIVTTPYGSSAASAADHYSYVPAPLVTKVTPNNGSTLGGESVTITGKNFTGATLVRFGSSDAEIVKVESATKISVRSPAMTESTVDVTVTTPGGTSAISTKDRFSYTPTITRVNPNTGPPVGGTVVTVTGTGFANGTTATKFKFGGTKASAVNCTSSTECMVTSPKHAEGPVDVVATVNEQNSPKVPQDQFTYKLI